MLSWVPKRHAPKFVPVCPDLVHDDATRHSSATATELVWGVGIVVAASVDDDSSSLQIVGRKPWCPRVTGRVTSGIHIKHR